jgi:Tn3 transposase DDE domain
LALFNTRYADRALTHLQRSGHPLDDTDVEHLSPLAHDHVNLHGRYSFSVPDIVREGELRPLPSTR